jgi:hypothetical protein
VGGVTQQHDAVADLDIRAAGIDDALVHRDGTHERMPHPACRHSHSGPRRPRHAVGVPDWQQREPARPCGAVLLPVADRIPGTDVAHLHDRRLPTRRGSQAQRPRHGLDSEEGCADANQVQSCHGTDDGRQ